MYAWNEHDIDKQRIFRWNERKSIDSFNFLNYNQYAFADDMRVLLTRAHNYTQRWTSVNMKQSTHTKNNNNNKNNVSLHLGFNNMKREEKQWKKN